MLLSRSAQFCSAPRSPPPPALPAPPAPPASPASPPSSSDVTMVRNLINQKGPSLSPLCPMGTPPPSSPTMTKPAPALQNEKRPSIETEMPQFIRIHRRAYFPALARIFVAIAGSGPPTHAECANPSILPLQSQPIYVLLSVHEAMMAMRSGVPLGGYWHRC
ncbi:hypothetical protein BS50DRAFT_274228 [Corynespora cassiicola Philippines]|uniref:Uncharacterized protein n=1 Tax=Corynespora cassiicola Philippines TaxID=1448308 RepID=A0A2T2P182_CORCC|nr:hypothetical protein BS50DRAFT_274228 [Corynespora cassiicola Philippines]